VCVFLVSQDPENMMMLGDLMRNSPYAVQHFLDNVVFPEIMRHQVPCLPRGLALTCSQSLKISASGQAIGGELLFKRRVGFSGTPSELMPVSISLLTLVFVSANVAFLSLFLFNFY
jgi:hypothetical protein